MSRIMGTSWWLKNYFNNWGDFSDLLTNSPYIVNYWKNRSIYVVLEILHYKGVKAMGPVLKRLSKISLWLIGLLSTLIFDVSLAGISAGELLWAEGNLDHSWGPLCRKTSGDRHEPRGRRRRNLCCPWWFLDHDRHRAFRLCMLYGRWWGLGKSLSACPRHKNLTLGLA